VAFYVGPVEFPAAPAEPKPRFAFLCDAGTDAPSLLALLKKYAEKSPAPPEANLKIEQQGTVVMITVGASEPSDFAVHTDGLNTSPVYRGALKRIRPNSAIVSFIDCKAILAKVHEGVMKTPDTPPEVAQRYDAVVGALGVSNLGEVIYGGGFDGKGWAEDLFIAMKGPRTGVLSLLDAGPMDEAVLATVPSDAVAFSVVRFDFMKLFNTAKDVISKIDPGALEEFNQGIAEANTQAGFDVEKDLLATLGDHWVYYRWPSPDGIGLAQAAVHKLKDADTFAKTLKKIEEQATAQAGGKLQLQDSEVDGIAVTQVTASMVNFTIAVRGGYLYVSSTPSSVSAAVSQVEKKQPSIVENADYREARGALPKAPVSSLEYANPAKIYPEEYRTVAMLLPFLGAAGINVPVQILPNPAKSAPYLTPGASEYWTDEDGAHFASRGAIPGAGLFGQKQSEGIPALAAGSPALPQIFGAADWLLGTRDRNWCRSFMQKGITLAGFHDGK
jgi:hypothetical protein